MNRFLRERLKLRTLQRKPVVEFGDRIVELNPELLESPSDRGDWRAINRGLRIVYAGYATGFIILALLIGTVIYIYGCPPKAKGADLFVEVGPGQAGGRLALAGVSSWFPPAAPWLRLDPYAAAIRREHDHAALGADLTIEAQSDWPHAAISLGRAYWFDPTDRVVGHGQWHFAARAIFGRLTVGLHHWSNGGGTLGPGNGENIGENFLTAGWRW